MNKLLLAEAGLLGVPRSKNCVEVLISEEEGSDFDINDEPDYGGTHLAGKRARGSAAVGEPDHGGDEFTSKQPRTSAAVGRKANGSRYTAERDNTWYVLYCAIC